MREVMELVVMLTGLPPEMIPAVLSGALVFLVALETPAGRRPDRSKEAPMSWPAHRRRHAVLRDALSRRWPGRRVALAELPGAAEVFGTEENLLLALQQRWSTHLAARLDQAVEDAVAGHPQPAHLVWDRLAAEQPALRSLLDAGAARYPRLRAAREADHRMIAAHAALTGEATALPSAPAPLPGEPAARSVA